ncbi:MAG: GNAT family N-acetyltransferase [bacterium]|nr:GNAT family N-acetyltransferase [bacterium]
MNVEVLKKKDIKSYMEHIKRIFDYDVSEDIIEKLIRKNKVLIIKKDDVIVASVIVEERFEYIKNKKYYKLEYLGVSKQYRREGLATKLFEKIEEMIKENNIDYIELTSGNQRRGAYYFYKSKHFKIKDTTVFVKFY